MHPLPHWSPGRLDQSDALSIHLLGFLRVILTLTTVAELTRESPTYTQRTEVPVLTLCERYLKHGTPFKRVCSNVQKARDWLRATVNSLTLIQETVIRQALESLPGDDDRQWVGVDKVYGEVGVGNEDSFSQRMGDRRDRSKREEPELRDVQYHIFGIAGAGDVDYNRQLIKVLQESFERHE